jgi:hypothetical protein
MVKIDLRLLARAAKSLIATEPNCSASVFDWILFVSTLSLLSLGWWIFEVPTLFTPEPHREATLIGGSPKPGRFRRFHRALAWNCIRALMPSYVAIIAMARSKKAKEWATLYYFGYDMEAGDDAARQLTGWQWAKISLTDVSHLVLECLLAYRAAATAEKRDYPLVQGWWLFASLPASIIGLYLILIRALPNPPRRFFVGLIGFLLLVFVGVAFILAIYFSSGMHRTVGAAFAGSMALSWSFTMFPLTLCLCCGGRFHALFYLLSAAARAMPLLAEMMSPREKFPFCSINHPGLLATFGVVAGICVFYCAAMGSGLCERYRKNLEQLLETAEEGQEEHVALQAREVT